MCRNIKTLHNFEPPANAEEIHAAALQFVRKLSGTTRPSKVNQPVIDDAVERIGEVVTDLLAQLTTHAPPKNREEEARKARLRAQQRFAG